MSFSYISFSYISFSASTITKIEGFVCCRCIFLKHIRDIDPCILSMAEYLEVSLLNLNTSFSSFTDDVMDGKAILYGDILTYHSYCVQFKKFKDAWLDDSSNM